MPGISLRPFYILRWLSEIPRERLERIYGELADLVARGVISAEIEATYGLDQFPEALAHAQQVLHRARHAFEHADRGLVFGETLDELENQRNVFFLRLGNFDQSYSSEPWTQIKP